MSDGTFFYNRTAYRESNLDMPSCFSDLDLQFAKVGLDVMDAIGHPVVALAENLCRRMSHVDLQAEMIESAISDDLNIFVRSDIVSCLLVGHFAACKSVLDAIALALNQQFGLGLKGGNLDLKKDAFWKTFRAVSIIHADKYQVKRPIIRSIGDWRDEAVHRIPPLTVVSGEGDPNASPPPIVRIDLCLVMGIDTSTLSSLLRKGPNPGNFGHPLHFHRLWRDSLVEICGFACEDMAAGL